MDRLDRKDLRNATFDVALRGYDKRQVDERIRLLGGELAAAEHALRAVQTRAGSLEAEVNRLRSSPGGGPGGRAEHHFGARVEKILLTAEEEAREIRSQAGAEATALVEQARAEAKEYRARAGQELAAQQAEAEKLTKVAAHESDQLRNVVAKEAEEVRNAARGQAAQLVEQARIEADRLVASATESVGQRERASAQEMQRLCRLRDQVNAELYRAKNLLDGFFPAMAKGAQDQRDQGAVVEPTSRDVQPNSSARR